MWRRWPEGPIHGCGDLDVSVTLSPYRDMLHDGNWSFRTLRTQGTPKPQVTKSEGVVLPYIRDIRHIFRQPTAP